MNVETFLWTTTQNNKEVKPMYNRERRRMLEHVRQEGVREGWRALREVARSMKENMGTYRKMGRETFLKNYESTLKGLLAQRSTRDHKALALFRQQAAYIKNTGNMDYSLQYLSLCGPRFL